MTQERLVRSVLRQWRAKKGPGFIPVLKLSADEKRLQFQLLAILENPRALKAEIELFCAFDADKAFNRWREKQRPAETLELWRYASRWSATAVFLLAFLVFAPEPEPRPEQKAVIDVLTAPPGQQRWVTLADGTQVWLNNASGLRYPEHFENGSRTVELTGEAYFEVAADTGKPFVVKTATQETEVLGTSFDINAYPDETIIKTTVITGRVRVRSAYQTFILKADQQLRLDTTGRSLGLDSVAAGEAIAWKDGALDYRHTTLQDFLRQVGRRYDLEVSFAGHSGEIHWAGILPPHASLNQLLDFFEANHIHCRLRGRQLFLHGN